MFRRELSPRISFPEPVTLIPVGRGRPTEGRGVNLRAGGLLVRLRARLAVGSRHEVRFELPGSGSVEALATVVRAAADDRAGRRGGAAIALRFDALDELSVRRLETYLDAQRASSAGLAERAAHLAHEDLDEAHDPVCTGEFLAHARAHHAAHRPVRRRAVAVG
ncbi:MAG: PilZ domain-containing protein [Deltaproteobacteria bacterium]|nr:PilZ domain-containing protein [Deltaproteobacteria bacterium]